MRKQVTNKIVQAGILAAIASILYITPFLQFPLPFFPGFLKIQFSNLPAIIGGFVAGPIWGAIIVFIKALLKILIMGSDTFIVGELADVIIGVSVVLTSSLIYKKIKTKTGAVISLVIGSLVWITTALLANGLILLPAYEEIYGLQAILDYCEVIPGINENNYVLLYLLVGALPFNLLLASATSLITFVVYKRISILFDKME